MSAETRIDATTAVILIVAALVALPLLTMGFGGMMGFGGAMGYGMMDGTTGGGWSLVGLAVQVAVLAAILGGGYLLVTRTRDGDSGDDAALEELRRAYARGDLTDEEFETRRDRLEREE
ncbi:SHOCT domain-containing protein [Halobaculum marinum]|uniref:SHOCT domain-containing protein n=1 Tax=Halobaculum marinum TaxID=3031996 RepID=A0ABD5X037_9EURY|nr:SHOCT domain-containing protein [Halobaculum sp. DT55]